MVGGRTLSKWSSSEDVYSSRDLPAEDMKSMITGGRQCWSTWVGDDVLAKGPRSFTSDCCGRPHRDSPL